MNEQKNRMQRRPAHRGPMGGPPGFMMVGEKPKNFKGTLKRLITYLKPFKVRLFLVFLMAIASTVFSILSPKIMGKATTRLFEGLIQKYMHIPGAKIDFEYIGHILLILIGMYVLSSMFNYIQQYIMVGLAQNLVYNMRKEVNLKLSKLPLKYYDSHLHGDVLSRIANDVDNIANTLQQSLTQVISAFVTLIGIIIMMLTISPLLTLIALATLPVSVIVTQILAKKSQKYFAEQQRYLGDLNGHVEEMYTGHIVVKSFGYEKKSIDKFKEVNNKLYNASFRAQFISSIIMPAMNFIGNIGYVLICVVGGIMVTKKKIEIGDIQAFIQYSRQFTQPIVQTANIANIIQSTIASAERVFEILDEIEEIPDKEDAKELDSPKGDVAFENVKFGYSEDKILFENMNIDVKSGQTVAIVGPTGAGKTTVVNLLMRFYDVLDGKITIDGVDIRDMKRSNLRSIFGMVLQDTWLFNGTIKENIAYGKKDATDDEIIAAAKLAHAHHFIKTLPHGYNTILNEEASNISQGQKQLLTIARAILANPSVLILDEATSNVDTRTELQIQKAMANLMKGRTSFIIAHRLSTIKNADLILVMNEGAIIEKGTHEELLAKKGFYAELYQSQFALSSVS